MIQMFKFVFCGQCAAAVVAGCVKCHILNIIMLLSVVEHKCVQRHLAKVAVSKNE